MFSGIIYRIQIKVAQLYWILVSTLASDGYTVKIISMLGNKNMFFFAAILLFIYINNKFYSGDLLHNLI